MTAFRRLKPYIALDGVVCAAFGGSSEDRLRYTENDRGRYVKFISQTNVVFTDIEEEAQGILQKLEPYTVNGGYAFGLVRLFEPLKFWGLMHTFEEAESLRSTGRDNR